MIVLDAAVLIAFLDERDAHHEAAVAVLAAAAEADQELGISTINLAEVLVVPAKDGWLTEATDALARLGVVELAPSKGAAVLLAQMRARTRLRMPDCWVLEAAVAHHGQVATFDVALQAAARGEGLTVSS